MADKNETNDAILIRIMKKYKDESKDSRIDRDKRNKINWNAYNSVQDFSHKTDTQSKQFSPKTSMGVEAVHAFIKKALVGLGEYFIIELEDQSIMTNRQARALLKYHLDSDETDFITKLGDAVKIGLLSSLMIFKVRSETKDGQFNLLIDIDKPEYYYPDPKNRGLYEIHEVIKDYHEVLEAADNGLYIKEQVEKLNASFVDAEKEWNEKRQQGQGADSKTFRREVTLHELWGTILGEEGEVLEKNVICTMANERVIIRRPEPNPRFSRKSPLIASPIIRVPKSVWHKALYDDPVKLNLFINELQNLIMDGGAAAAQNVKTLKDDNLKEPSQASGGIPPGTTLLIKEDVPVNEKTMQVVETGKVPQDALNVLNLILRDWDMSSLHNDIRQGLLAQRNVKATEVVEKQDASNDQLDAFAKTVEKAIVKVFKESWIEILQFREGFATLDNIIGARAALALSAMTPQQRFVQFGMRATVKVDGISALISKSRNFQKLILALDTIFKNPVLTEAWNKKYSADKALTQVLQGLDIDPSKLELEEGDEGISQETFDMTFGKQETGEGARRPSRNLSPDTTVPQPATGGNQ